MPIDVCKEVHQNFLDFSYEANSQRAFPSALDGLKPGQRACLWEMYSKGFVSSKPHVKSAKISGAVIGELWPHGDTAIYDTFARMSQPWINNIPEVDWHGANGSQKAGPEPASARYTEARLSKASEDGFFGNINKNVVNMIPNFSEDAEWPEVFPAIFPRLFVNGSQGIGMTIAQNWLCGNLNEFFEKVKRYIVRGRITYDNIYPDFPSGGVIINKSELHTIYETGRGRCVLRAKTEIDGNNILITELPYQVYIEPLLKDIKQLIEEEKITGITDVLNKSDKNTLLIEIQCSGTPRQILNKLFKLTDLQKIYNANQYAMITKVPELLNLDQYINAYINHNVNCIYKEYQYDYNQAELRLEIVQGLLIALNNIDDIIALIKGAANTEDAKTQLMIDYELTERQAKAILDMKLSKLTHLEITSLEDEANELRAKMANYDVIINDTDAQKSIFIERLKNFVDKYGFERRTEVIDLEEEEETEESTIIPEQCMVILTASGLVKRIPTTAFKVQNKNGKGVKTQDDITIETIKTNTADTLMVFTSAGKMYSLIVGDIPEGNNTSKGVSLKMLLDIGANEEVETIYSIHQNTTAKYILFVTKQGMLKKTELNEYIRSGRNKKGMLAIKIKPNDSIVNAILIDEEEVLIITANGQVEHIATNSITPIGRTGMGIIGIRLNEGDEVIGCEAVRDPADLLALFTENGYGKKTAVSEYNLQNRGGLGVKGYNLNKKTGKIVSSSMLNDSDTILIVGAASSLCILGADVPTSARVSRGSTLIKGTTIVSTSKI